MSAPDLPSPLTGPACLIRLGGVDAAAFAQAQFAARLPADAAAGWAWTAWLDAAARVRLLALAWPAADGFHLLGCGGDADALQQALRRYVLRARVEIEARAGFRLRPGGPLPLHALAADADAWRLGLGAYSIAVVPAAAPGAGAAAARAAERAAITAGHPWLPAGTGDSLLPPALGLHRLGAVVDDKGCYPGQELVNRLRRRGGHKYHLVHARWDAAPPPGAPVTQAGRRLGTVLRRSGAEVLAVLHETAATRIDALDVVQTFAP